MSEPLFAPLLAVADERLLACAGFTLLGAMIRGFSGFGSIMIMIPGFSLILGSAPAIALAHLLETWTVLQLVRIAVREADWRAMAPVILACFVTIPIGVAILVRVDPDVMRRVIAIVVLLFCALMLLGWRYHGRRTRMHSAAAGATSGVLCGSTGIAGPPVILYLMSGPDQAASNRANIMAFLLSIQPAILALFATVGILTLDLIWMALWLLPVNVFGLWLGHRLFGLASELTFRRVALSLLMANATVVLVA